MSVCLENNCRKKFLFLKNIYQKKHPHSDVTTNTDRYMYHNIFTKYLKQSLNITLLMVLCLFHYYFLNPRLELLYTNVKMHPSGSFV